MNYGILLVAVQGLVKGQTVTVLDKGDTISEIKPDGYNKTYSVPTKYIKLQGEELEYPRCQEVASLWMK